MRWAKTRGQEGTHRLTSSSMPEVSAADLVLSARDLVLGPDDYDRPTEISALVAAHYGVPAESVLVTASASYATALAFLALLEPGDEVLVETPVYPNLRILPGLAGATVRALPRRFERGFAVDAEELRSLLTERTRLVALTNLHNPSGVRLADAVLDQCAQAAAEAGAHLFVDEVYLDMAGGARTSFRAGENRIAVSSATKAYGLGGLRVGWLFAPPALVERALRLNDLFVVHPPFPSARIACRIFERQDEFQRRIREVIGRARPVLDRFMAERPDLEWVAPEHGILAFPRLRGVADSAPFLERLLGERGVNLTPGSFFGAPAHFRVAFGRAPDLLAEALRRLGAALDELQAAARPSA